MKKCGTCGEVKPLDMFFNMSASKDGKGYRCKPCDTLARKKWQKDNPEKSSYSARNRRLKFVYGIDVPIYEDMLEKQGGLCAICGCSENRTAGERKDWNFAVDHNHNTGKVRGLLCNTCNRGLGMLGDTIERLENALAYLKKND